MKKDKNNLVEYHAKIVLDSSDLDKAIEKLEKLLEKIKELNNALKEAKTLISENVLTLAKVSNIIKLSIIASSSANIDTVISLDGKEIAKAVRKSNYDNGKESHK